MKRLEKEIEFYKEITGRLTTALFLSIGRTVAVIRKEGLEIWALIFYMRKWKTKVEELSENEDNN
jgi:hypothetical protein